MNEEDPNSFEYEKLLYFIDLPLCVISAITNFLIFIAYIYFRELRIYNFRLVFYLAISELLTSSGI